MSITTPTQMIIPAVRALAATVRETFAGKDDAVQVITGAERVVKEDDFVLVAAPSNGGSGVIMTASTSDQGHAQAWTFNIVILVSTWSGTLDLASRLTRAQGMLDTLCEAVADNPTLDGTVAVADIGSSAQLATYNDEDGVAAELGLTVACEIY